jgi:hypothetical protein
MKKPTKKQWTLAAAVLLLLLLGLGAWRLRPDPDVEKVKSLRQELFEKGGKMSAEERRSKWHELREAGRRLTPGQRRALRDDFRKRRKQQLERYFTLSAEDKEKMLDQLIDRMEARRRQWQQNRANSAAGQNGQERTGRGGWSRLSAEERDQRRRQWLDSTTPEERSQRDQFWKDLRSRMNQRGLGGWGWGRGR